MRTNRFPSNGQNPLLEKAAWVADIGGAIVAFIMLLIVFYPPNNSPSPNPVLQQDGHGNIQIGPGAENVIIHQSNEISPSTSEGGKSDNSSATKQTIEGTDRSPVGIWEGSLEQPGYGSYTVILQIDPLKNRGIIGTTNYPSLGCSGSLTLQNKTDEEQVLIETIQSGEGRCRDGKIKIKRTDQSTLSFNWYHANGRPGASGTLGKPRS